MQHANKKAQQACTFVQSDQHICHLQSRKYCFQPCSMRNFNILTCLCSWADWFEPYLVGNPEDKFSPVQPQISFALKAERIFKAREGWLLYFYCIPAVLCLLVFENSSSCYLGLVCGMRLCYILVMLSSNLGKHYNGHFHEMWYMENTRWVFLISSLPGKALRMLVNMARLAEQFNMRSRSLAG